MVFKNKPYKCYYSSRFTSTANIETEGIETDVYDIVWEYETYSDTLVSGVNPSIVWNPYSSSKLAQIFNNCNAVRLKLYLKQGTTIVDETYVDIKYTTVISADYLITTEIEYVRWTKNNVNVLNLPDNSVITAHGAVNAKLKFTLGSQLSGNYYIQGIIISKQTSKGASGNGYWSGRVTSTDAEGWSYITFTSTGFNTTEDIENCIVFIQYNKDNPRDIIYDYIPGYTILGYEPPEILTYNADRDATDASKANTTMTSSYKSLGSNAIITKNTTINGVTLTGDTCQFTGLTETASYPVNFYIEDKVTSVSATTLLSPQQVAFSLFDDTLGHTAATFGSMSSDYNLDDGVDYANIIATKQNTMLRVHDKEDNTAKYFDIDQLSNIHRWLWKQTYTNNELDLSDSMGYGSKLTTNLIIGFNPNTTWASIFFNDYPQSYAPCLDTTNSTFQRYAPFNTGLYPLGELSLDRMLFVDEFTLTTFCNKTAYFWSVNIRIDIDGQLILIFSYNDTYGTSTQFIANDPPKGKHYFRGGTMWKGPLWN